MFEKITNGFIGLHTIEMTCEKAIKKAIYIYDFIQNILDDPDIPICTYGREASFDLTLAKIGKDDKFIVKWGIAARKDDVNYLFEKLAMYEDKLTDNVDSSETVYIKLDNDFMSMC